jgi:hypothetical protein
VLVLLDEGQEGRVYGAIVVHHLAVALQPQMFDAEIREHDGKDETVGDRRGLAQHESTDGASPLGRLCGEELFRVGAGYRHVGHGFTATASATRNHAGGGDNLPTPADTLHAVLAAKQAGGVRDEPGPARQGGEGLLALAIGGSPRAVGDLQANNPRRVAGMVENKKGMPRRRARQRRGEQRGTVGGPVVEVKIGLAVVDAVQKNRKAGDARTAEGAPTRKVGARVLELRVPKGEIETEDTTHIVTLWGEISSECAAAEPSFEAEFCNSML